MPAGQYRSRRKKATANTASKVLEDFGVIKDFGVVKAQLISLPVCISR
jgi:hypothetical protein